MVSVSRSVTLPFWLSWCGVMWLGVSAFGNGKSMHDVDIYVNITI
jgi:hypothetical protein